jgi:spore maturation protein SpmB
VGVGVLEGVEIDLIVQYGLDTRVWTSLSIKRGAEETTRWTVTIYMCLRSNV